MAHLKKAKQCKASIKQSSARQALLGNGWPVKRRILENSESCKDAVVKGELEVMGTVQSRKGPS